jgi:hypothetical protein
LFFCRNPPKSIAAVRKNLAIIEGILNPDDTEYKAKDFIKSLTQEIYHKVDEFMVKMQAIVDEEKENQKTPLDDREIKRSLSGFLEKKEIEIGNSQVLSFIGISIC